MSEKNGQGSEHWMKSVALAAAATRQTHPPAYDLASNSNSKSLVHTPSALYGGQCGIPVLPQQPTDVAYASARFQAPPIHHGAAAATAASTPVALQQQISPTMLPAPTPTTNVPGPSGFVPPPFPTNPVTAATSVLTPNPFASGNNSGFAFAAAASAAGAFGSLEQFQRLSAVQQQLELGKIVNAINTTNSGQSATSPAIPIVVGPQIPPITAAQQTMIPATIHRTHGETATGSTNIGTINSTIAENVLSAISSGTGTGQLLGRTMLAGVKAPDEEKMRRVQQIVESSLDDFSKQTVSQILERVGTLKPIERLLLYLRLPGETAESDPLRQPQNPLGTRSEIMHTINWVRSHLEHDPQVSIPKQDVYNDYITYCERLNIKPLSTADFGKVMKQVFPGIRPRRLGTRGNSRYCYAAMRKTTQLVAPQLPQLGRNALSTADTTSTSTEIGECNESVLKTDCSCSKSHTTTTTTTTVNSRDESWDIVRNWAEKLLNIKIDNMKDLALRIKGNNTIGVSSTLPSALRTGPKKYTPREPKEKRLLADMGPLKKRRKKKRKGSSSSESSCNQPAAAAATTTTTTIAKVKDKNNSRQESSVYHSIGSGSGGGGGGRLSEDDKKSIKLVKIKQEIIDSPIHHNYQTTTQPPQPQVLLSHMPPMPQNALLNDNCILTQQQQQLQQQMMPMNLATEQRTILSKRDGSFTVGPYGDGSGAGTGAVRNLTSKIMQLSPNSQQSVSMVAEQQQSEVPHSQQQQQQQTSLVAIKDEVDEYNTSNIFCKKVLKAQQTKGFWTLPPNSNNNNNINNNLVPPIITTTASTPPPTDVACGNLDGTSYSGSSPVTNLTMGPPAQMTNSTSISPSSSLVVSDAGPKVVSRNMLLLRAKRAMAAEAAAAAAAGGSDDSGLPENLGLPRERVISICNMDKHELDDYFLEEAENEEDQETELLQYFQTGDAEEKRMNSLDAAEQNSNPTAINATSIPTTTTTTSTPIIMTTTLNETITTITTTKESSTMTSLSTKLLPTTTSSTSSIVVDATNLLAVPPLTMTTDKIQITLDDLSSSSSCSGGGGAAAAVTAGIINGNGTTMQIIKPSSSLFSSDVEPSSLSIKMPMQQNVAILSQKKNLTTTTSNAVGSASASLALMSQKHQQQHQQATHPILKDKQQQQEQLDSIHKRSQIGKLNMNNNKRKISLSNASNQNNNKNCIFLPISPNINNNSMTSTSLSNVVINNNNNNSNNSSYGNNTFTNATNSCFASPGITRLRIRAPALTKQQSLDFETSDNGSDPMIGASRHRRRSYMSSMPTSTSASAPPSPSVLQQYNSINAWSLGSNLINPNNSNNNTNVFTESVVNNVALLADQNSMDLENSLALASATGDVDFQMTPLSETQRSQSVPLSQLQRIQSPTFNRQLDSFQATYSACTSVNQTPVPPEFTGDSTNLFSENSNSQTALKLHEVDVLGQDSTALLDDVVDVSAMLSSPDFSTKFSSISLIQNATTTCSSTGSSSGYSSGTCGNAFSGGGIISRSVPSTPLPHHHQNNFGNSAFYSRRTDDFNLTINGNGGGGGGGGMLGFCSITSTIHNNNNNNMNNNNIGNGSNNNNNTNSYNTRMNYDISKSMPTTPITTPCFRYSPTDLQRDFLINGNTIDSLTSHSTFGGGGGGSGIGNSCGAGNLSTDTLIDENAPAADDVEAMMAGADILDNL